MTPQPQKANDPATLRCDDEPCLFHHNGICGFSCHMWIPVSPQQDHAMIYDADHPEGIPFSEYVNAQRAGAAAQAREKVLKLLEEWDYHNNRNFGKPHPLFSDMIRLVRENPDEVRKHLESLRTGGDP